MWSSSRMRPRPISKPRSGIGFAKLARVMSPLEAAGIVGPQNGAKKRDVLVGSLAELELILKAYMKGELV